MSDIKTLQNLVDQMSEIQKEMEEIQNGGKMRYEYDNARDFLIFIRDMSSTNKKANWGNDKEWQSEFQFLEDEINGFLKEEK